MSDQSDQLTIMESQQSQVQLQTVNLKDRIINRYKVEAILGSGGFSQVFKVKDLKTRQVLAMKISGGGTFLPESKDDEFTNVELAIREIRIMKKLSKGLGKGKQFCSLMTDWHFLENRVAILFPCYPLSISDFMNNFERRPFIWENIVAISFQLVQAVKFLHENKITHMDIKPHNLMLVCADYKILSLDLNGNDVEVSKKDFSHECIALRNTEIKLIDFGSCLRDEDKGKPYFIGLTDEYMAPEHILKNPTSPAYDIWCMGCTVIELYNGNPLFPHCSKDVHLVLIQKVIGEKIPEELAKNYELPKITPRMEKIAKDHNTLTELITWGPKDRIYFHDLLQNYMLKINPAYRATLAKIVSHPIFETTPHCIRQSVQVWKTPEILGYVSNTGP